MTSWSHFCGLTVSQMSNYQYCPWGLFFSPPVPINNTCLSHAILLAEVCGRACRERCRKSSWFTVRHAEAPGLGVDGGILESPASDGGGDGRQYDSCKMLLSSVKMQPATTNLGASEEISKQGDGLVMFSSTHSCWFESIKAADI
jgi:hypothetical protein